MSAARVLVQAPATSANLGPGFDAAGIALDWWDTLEVTVDEGGAAGPPVPMRVAGEQAELIPTGPGNLVRLAMERLAAAAGSDLPPVRLALVKGFPLGRGFGSSAAAVALGLLAARELVDPRLPDAEVLSLASELEGHPDNAAACLAGGATLSWREAATPPSSPAPGRRCCCWHPAPPSPPRRPTPPRRSRTPPAGACSRWRSPAAAPGSRATD